MTIPWLKNDTYRSKILKNMGYDINMTLPTIRFDTYPRKIMKIYNFPSSIAHKFKLTIKVYHVHV